MSYFQDVREVQDFIGWCRDMKIQGVEIDGIKVAFSPAAFVPEEPRPAKESEPKIDERTGYTEDELYP